jgi:hypothetical protein
MIGKCNVCGKEAELSVAASTCGACSYAYCQDCLKAGAEPYDALVSYIWCAGGRLEYINDTYKHIIAATLERVHKTPREFWEDVKKEDEAWEIYNESKRMEESASYDSCGNEPF